MTKNAAVQLQRNIFPIYGQQPGLSMYNHVHGLRVQGLEEQTRRTQANGVPVARQLKVGELARQTGITRQALHQYVLMGLLTPVSMTKGGQRLFDQAAVERVRLIQNLCANGYTLQSIRDIFFSKQGIS